MEDSQPQSPKPVGIVKPLWVFSGLSWQVPCFLYFVQEREMQRQMTNVKVVRSTDHNPDVYIDMIMEASWNIRVLFHGTMEYTPRRGENKYFKSLLPD